MRLLAQYRVNQSLIEEKIGHKFTTPKLLEQAFIHRSFMNEQAGEVEGHNERLEFLGDSVLGFIISDFLYMEFPQLKEGELSELRARLVESSALLKYVTELDVAQFLVVGKGEEKAGRKESHHANLVEAIIGAIYLDGGIDKARQFLFLHLRSAMFKIIESPDRNWKAAFQDYTQRIHQMKPVYELVKEEGPDHAKQFEVRAEINGEILGYGSGSSKKEAERNAAEAAMKKIEETS